LPTGSSRPLLTTSPSTSRVSYKPVPDEAVPRTYLEHSNDHRLPRYGAADHGFAPSTTALATDPQPVHWYHLYAGDVAGGSWQQIAGEHFEALRTAEFPGEVHVGIIGKDQARVSSWLDMAWPGWTAATGARFGYEQVTLYSLHEWSQGVAPNTPVLYAHTKGVWRSSHHQGLWRRCMQDTCVTGWRQCVAKLIEGYDVTGAHYLMPDDRAVGVPMMAGNYWWTTAGYLSGLPHPRIRDRYDAEAWVGLDDPLVYDFQPYGWPQHPHDLA